MPLRRRSPPERLQQRRDPELLSPNINGQGGQLNLYHVRNSQYHGAAEANDA